MGCSQGAALGAKIWNKPLTFCLKTTFFSFPALNFNDFEFGNTKLLLFLFPFSL